MFETDGAIYSAIWDFSLNCLKKPTKTSNYYPLIRSGGTKLQVGQILFFGARTCPILNEDDPCTVPLISEGAYFTVCRRFKEQSVRLRFVGQDQGYSNSKTKCPRQKQASLVKTSWHSIRIHSHHNSPNGSLLSSNNKQQTLLLSFPSSIVF